MVKHAQFCQKENYGSEKHTIVRNRQEQLEDSFNPFRVHTDLKTKILRTFKELFKHF